MNITDFLPVLNRLNNTDTPMKSFLNDSIGVFFELYEDSVDDLKEFVFIQLAEGFYLDLYGRDYNVPRLVDETDEHYRNRLIALSSKHSTYNALYFAFDTQLLTYNEDADDMMLLSDNHYLNTKYFVDCDDSTFEVIRRNYPMDTIVKWVD